MDVGGNDAGFDLVGGAMPCADVAWCTGSIIAGDSAKRQADWQVRSQGHGVTGGLAYQSVAGKRTRTAGTGDGISTRINTKSTIQNRFHAATGGESGIRTRVRILS